MKIPTIESIGDVRLADQTLRLHFNPKFDSPVNPANPGELWKGRGTFVHEWTHYFQFLVTPAGLSLARWRRELYHYLHEIGHSLRRFPSPLVSHIAENPEAQRAYRDYDNGLERISSLWCGWPDWSMLTDEVNVVACQIDPGYSLNVRLSDGTQHQFALGPFAIFEAWAFLTESLNINELKVVPSAAASQLPYTWPLHVLAGGSFSHLQDGAFVRTGWDVLNLLATASFYDRTLSLLTGSFDESSNAYRVARWFAERRITSARVIALALRRYEEFDKCLESVKNSDNVLVDGLSLFLSKLGLPPLDLVLSAIQEVAETIADSHQNEVHDQIKQAASANAAPDGRYVAAEIDILNTSIVAIRALRGSLYEGLMNPYHYLAPLVPTPVVAYLEEETYNWGFLRDIRTPPRLDDDLGRVQLRQIGLAIPDHIMFMRMYSKHIACYGSIDWPKPINRCPYATACQAIPDKQGISFCQDRDWRMHVASFFEGSIKLSGSARLTDAEIPGIEGAQRELEQMAADSDESKERSLDLRRFFQLDLDEIDTLKSTNQ